MASFTGLCIVTCTTPRHGYVEKGQRVAFELLAWDAKKYSYLKHFENVTPVAPATVAKNSAPPAPNSGAEVVSGGDGTPDGGADVDPLE